MFYNFYLKVFFSILHSSPPPAPLHLTPTAPLIHSSERVGPLLGSVQSLVYQADGGPNPSFLF